MEKQPVPRQSLLSRRINATAANASAVLTPDNTSPSPRLWQPEPQQGAGSEYIGAGLDVLQLLTTWKPPSSDPQQQVACDQHVLRALCSPRCCACLTSGMTSLFAAQLQI